MSRIAIIGAGISGLAAGYYLSRQHEVHVFEREKRIGGHTNTVTARSAAGPVAVDTGFIVHNEKTYPHFCALMRELGVETQASDMSFGVSAPGGAFEYSSRGAGGYFAQTANVFRPAHWALLSEILRFNREAPKLLEGGQETATARLTIGEFLAGGAYKAVFAERYLYPMAAAVWSMPPAQVAAFPALTLVRFFENHGMLGINTHPQWRTIRGGSNSYLEPLTAPFAGRIRTGAAIEKIWRHDDGVRVELHGETLEFDEIVFACHGDQVLPLLGNSTPAERRVLGQFRSSRNETCLHTDERMLPVRKAARASWNYRLASDAAVPVTVTYHMNRLQQLAVGGRAVPEQYCVSLNANPTSDIHSDQVLQRMMYEHPVYDSAAVAAQGRWGEISGRRFRTHYCGAYWFYGFHEDGVRSALRVAQTLGVRI